MALLSRPSLTPEIGPDGLPTEAPVISYTEKIIEEEQLQVKKYIKEHYSKIRDVERELENLSLEMKLTAGPKRAALEHLRKKIEMTTERIHSAKLKEEQAYKAWKVASMVVKDEEMVKQKLCDDLNHLVHESSNSQFSRLEELKRRLEALNPSKGKGGSSSLEAPEVSGDETIGEHTKEQQPSVDGEGRGRKVAARSHGRRAREIRALPKGQGPVAAGWTGAGFDVDARN